MHSFPKPPTPGDLPRYYAAAQASESDARLVRLRCPACRHIGVFESTSLKDVSAPQRQPEGRSWPASFGVRRCPNTDCSAAVFVVHHQGTVVQSFPPEVIDFDASNLPEHVLSSLEEAITCHAAGCYRAAAIMVRRTLEAVCAEREAVGPNLAARVEALDGVVTIPAELISGLHALRLLGNDAAHTEAQIYDQVGCEEVETAIDVVKLLLLTIYQYVSVIDRLKALQREGS